MAAQQAQILALAARLRHVEKMLDTLGTPLWKRWLFRLDGWGPWYIVNPRRSWRPWHRWLRSS